MAGLEAEVLTQAADAVEKQTGLSFSFGETEDGIQITVEGRALMHPLRMREIMLLQACYPIW